MMTATRCACCGKPLDQHVGRGRPNRYCGPACRRLIEAETRRLSRRLEAFDDELVHLERHVHRIGYSGSQEAAEAKLQFVQAQRNEALQRYERLVRQSEGDLAVDGEDDS